MGQATGVESASPRGRCVVEPPPLEESRSRCSWQPAREGPGVGDLGDRSLTQMLE